MNENRWIRSQKLVNEDMILDISKDLDIVLPNEYIQCIMENNAAVSRCPYFEMPNGTIKVFDHFISLRYEDRLNVSGTIKNCFSHVYNETIYPFATDPFGNLICFNYTSSTEYSGGFVDFEKQELTEIADTFSEFLDKLHE